MYKTETHLHTAEVSGCAHVSAKEMVKAYAEAGYTTVFITDHYKKRYFELLGDIPWEEKIEKYLSGYMLAREEGEKLGIHVLFAIELTFKDGWNDYLVYGITPDFLRTHPRLHESSIEEFYSFAKSFGFLVIQAHPFRNNECFPTPEYVDGFEIYNSNPRHKDYSEKTETLVKENNLLYTAGSDAHQDEDIGLSGVLSDFPISNADDFIRLIESGCATIIKK